jgi:hypothetical protein
MLYFPFFRTNVLLVEAQVVLLVKAYVVFFLFLESTCVLLSEAHVPPLEKENHFLGKKISSKT